jgi:hypothetical protein
MAEQQQMIAEQEAHWREQHDRQPYAKGTKYEDFAPAYRMGYEGALQHHGKTFDEIEENLAVQWQKAPPGSSLPWDTVRPAVNLAWERMAGVISPRESDRGTRDFI